MFEADLDPSDHERHCTVAAVQQGRGQLKLPAPLVGSCQVLLQQCLRLCLWLARHLGHHVGFVPAATGTPHVLAHASGHIVRLIAAQRHFFLGSVSP